MKIKTQKRELFLIQIFLLPLIMYFLYHHFKINILGELKNMKQIKIQSMITLTNISTLSSYLKKYECHGEYEQYQTNVELVIDDYSVILPELPAGPPPLTRMPSVHIKYT